MKLILEYAIHLVIFCSRSIQIIIIHVLGRITELFNQIVWSWDRALSCLCMCVRVRLLPMRQLLLMELSDKIRCGWRVKLSGYEII